MKFSINILKNFHDTGKSILYQEIPSTMHRATENFLENRNIPRRKFLEYPRTVSVWHGVIYDIDLTRCPGIVMKPMKCLTIKLRYSVSQCLLG